MATEEPAPVLTLKERIAALQLAQATDNPTPKARPAVLGAAKPSPSPLPKRPTNSLASADGTPQPVCRSPSECGPKRNSATPPPPGRRKEPPALPPRRQSQPSAADQPPALPPRRPSELSVSRRQSNDSISSVMSRRSSVSATSSRTGISAASEGNPATGSRFRIKAPEYDPAKLPALPERRAQPPPSLPTRREEPAVHQPNEWAPQRPAQLASQHGFNSEAAPPPIPSNRPRPPLASASSLGSAAPLSPPPLIVELNANTFDDIILRSGKPAFVDFYAPFCKYCKELDPVYEELAKKYEYQNITIAKIDSYTQKPIGERYEVQRWPTLKFFDGTGGSPVGYQWSRDIEWMSRFIDEQMAALPALPAAPPPIPMASRPVF